MLYDNYASSQKLEEFGKPKEPRKLEEPGKPEEPRTPEEPGKPEEPIKLEESQKPKHNVRTSQDPLESRIGWKYKSFHPDSLIIGIASDHLKTRSTLKDTSLLGLL